jgi:NitT/TauT family transport system substrate-binding protein
VFRSFLAFGRSTFNSVYTTENFAKQYPVLVKAIFDEMKSATTMLQRDPDQAAALLSKDTENKTPAARFKGWITGPDVSWDMTPHAFVRTAAFMKEIGMLSKVPATIRDIELPHLKGAGD